MERPLTKIGAGVFFLIFLGFSGLIFGENAIPSQGNDPKLSKPKNLMDWHWLPDLTGLPNEEQIDLLTEQISKVVTEEKDSQCKEVASQLRMMVFQHFVIRQYMANAHNIYFNDQVAHHWAHILAMILKESSGDSTNVTDMSNDSISTYTSETDLQNWRKILSDTVKNHIKLNSQTNFGLTQTSADRLFVAFSIAKNKNTDTEYLIGKEGDLTQKKINLNSAIAIRRLIWFYQDFAQGRMVQSDSRIHHRDIYKPQFFYRYQIGLKMAYLYCGTRFMFQERHFKNPEEETENIEGAMASISYCKLGNSKSGYGRSQFDEKCFAKWVTLCPALNIDIAILTPLSYFETRNTKPVCESTFKRLITQKPGGQR